MKITWRRYYMGKGLLKKTIMSKRKSLRSRNEPFPSC
jgi:hypothetical protein